MPSSTTPGPVVVVLQVQHPTSTTSTVAPPTTTQTPATTPATTTTTPITTLDPPTTIGPAAPVSTSIPLAHPASPAGPHGSLPITGAPLVVEVGTGMTLLLAGAMTALAARRRRASVRHG
ncbi:MAG TPA: hypothetical protein VG435_10830 [Acidimicrobiales bacterium]|jgi:hypothetical protein|nr:hypothetical protein [Acidimicrobiales bacterium]